ncbi:hypothetical protein [Amycolatopsis sp. YIM 10]|uniref:hypothetical protein n=1 Tax=Amycolatopsis sp. YIM 10 TaxID=2653857 RepID=UPI0012903284|nr:hypothetical protein [Amycolatopsis sp. YIM 10]QFU87844.1 hypothetical protein YIM_13290 [Amycolatopsis sp. YIM 10]QFU94843.1 hypothetical protein YIM_48590 [Amycolatopsis sp. YIM 10]
MNKEILTALREPFTGKEIGKLPKVTCRACSDPKKDCDAHERKKCSTCKAFVSTAHIHLDYVGHAHITERLLNVDPLWSWEPVAFSPHGLPALDDKGGLWIRLTVGGMTRYGYGHEGGGGHHGGDSMKATIGDAIKNAAMRFGAALDLWKKEPAAPVEATPVSRAEKPKLREEDQRTVLRAEIAGLGKTCGWDTAAVAEDFTTWSQGGNILRAGVAVLAEYKKHLQESQP